MLLFLCACTITILTVGYDGHAAEWISGSGDIAAMLCRYCVTFVNAATV